MLNALDMVIERVKKFSYLIVFFSFFVSVLYLIGYWSTFHINIFEFLSLADAVKISVYPLIGYFFIIFISTAIGAPLGKISVNFSIKRAVQNGSGSPESVVDRLKKHRIMTDVIYVCAQILIFIICYIYSPYSFWIVIPASLLYPLHLLLRKNIKLIEALGNESIVTVVIPICVTICFLSFGLGKYYSTTLYQNKKSIIIEGKNMSMLKGYRYIGKINKYYFMKNDNTNIFIYNEENETIISLSDID